ncbi:MAG: HD domain-containing phosphohydrolase, partial [Bacillota bacterium]
MDEAGILKHLYAQQDLWHIASEMRWWHESLFKHAVRTADLAMSVGYTLGLSFNEVKALMLGGFLHDYGKVVWPKGMVEKCLLTDDDRILVELHPSMSVWLAQANARLTDVVVLRIIEEHHERNGRGYPRRLTNSDIHPLSKIVSCVECYTAQTEARPYRSHPLKRDDAFKILYAEGFEPQLLHALQQTLGGTEI